MRPLTGMPEGGRGFAFLMWIFVVLFLGLKPAISAPAPKAQVSTALSAETFSVQTQLEELVTRRIVQALSTRMDRDAYTVNTVVALHKIDPPQPLVEEDEQDFNSIPAALQLGVIETRTDEGGELVVKGGGAGFEVDRVKVLVGVKPEMPKELVESTTKWLRERVTSEFGKSAELEVSSIERLPARVEPAPPPAPPETMFDQLRALQGLVGQILLAFALMGAVILWRILNSSSSQEGKGGLQASVQANLAQPEGSKGSAVERESAPAGFPPAGDWDASQEPGAEKLKRAAQTLVEKHREGLSPVVGSWIQAGADGLAKLVCFLDAVSGTNLEIQVPQEVADQLMPVFDRIAAMPSKERQLILRQAYWDLVSYRSLGTDALVKPFSFLGQLQDKRIQQLVMDENPRLKAVVALNMPDAVRDKFIQGIDHEERKRILSESIGLTELEVDEIRSIDSSLRSKTKGEGPKKRSLSAQPMVLRLIESFGVEEELSLLRELSSSDPAKVNHLRSTYPSVAFLAEWRDQNLGQLLSAAGIDEVLALVACIPALRDRVMALAPPTLSDVLREELPNLDRISPDVRASGLRQLALRLKKGVASGDIKLEECFEPVKSDAGVQAPRAA